MMAYALGPVSTNTVSFVTVSSCMRLRLPFNTTTMCILLKTLSKVERSQNGGSIELCERARADYARFRNKRARAHAKHTAQPEFLQLCQEFQIKHSFTNFV